MASVPRINSAPAWQRMFLYLTLTGLGVTGLIWMGLHFGSRWFRAGSVREISAIGCLIDQRLIQAEIKGPLGVLRKVSTKFGGDIDDGISC